MISARDLLARRRPWPSVPRCEAATLPDRRLLSLLLIGVAVAGWQTLGTLLPYADGDTPLSFVPLVPIAGAFFLWRLFDPQAIREHNHDAFVDTVVLVFLLIAAAVFLLLLPVYMSWDYWLDRLDVPGLILLLATVVVGAWGLPGLYRLAPGMLYLLLAWPLPLSLIDNWLIPPMTQATIASARFILPLLPLGVRADRLDASQLLVPYHGHAIQVAMVQACSGINGAIGLAVVAMPLAWMARGSWEVRGLWLVLGVVMSALTNVVRIVLIVAGVALLGPATALNQIHPVLGLLLFGLGFAALLAVASLLGVELPPIFAAERGERRELAGAPGWRLRRLFFLLAVLIAAAVAESNLGQFNWLSASVLPRVGLTRAADLFHPPRGWQMVHAQRIEGWEPLFGPSTLSSVMTIVAPGRSAVDVQAVISQDDSSFTTFGVEQCYLFHGFALRADHRISLGNGVTATLIDFDRGRHHSASLYWLQPVQTPRGQYRERIILIAGDQGAVARLPSARSTAAPGVVGPVQALAQAIADYLSPWIGGSAGPEFTQFNRELQALGQAVIAQERATRT